MKEMGPDGTFLSGCVSFLMDIITKLRIFLFCVVIGQDGVYRRQIPYVRDCSDECILGVSSVSEVILLLLTHVHYDDDYGSDVL